MTPATTQDRRESDMRIQSLENQIKDGFSRVESLLTALDARLRNVENCQAASQASQNLMLNEHERSIGGLEKRIESLESVTKSAAPWVGLVKWLAGALGTLVLSLLWAIFTGKVSIRW